MTIAYPIKNDQLLLGKKIKQGSIGQGYYLGFGGKVETEETFEQAAKREVLEEAGLKVTDMKEMGSVYFYFPTKKNKTKWNNQVKIFLVTDWQGQPQPSNEMKPKWFDLAYPPYNLMWHDNQFWTPHVLMDHPIEAHFLYNHSGTLVDEYSLKFLN